MRRVRYYEHGGPDVLTLEEMGDPVAGEGQVRITVEGVGGSFIDTVMRAGTSIFGQPPLPASPHGDVVGTVDAIGAGVDPEWKGKRVAAVVVADAYADAAVADADWLVPVPEHVELGQASILGIPGPVALLALRTGRLAPGETVLIHAAAGDVGNLATQLARLEGAKRVIATAGSRPKLDFALAHGADAAINYNDPTWTEQVQAAAPDGVDVALDSIGGAVSAATLKLLAPGGRHVIYGAASKELPQLPAVDIMAMRSVMGFGLLPFRASFPKAARGHLDELAAHLAEGRLQVEVAATVPLTEAPRAHALLEDRSRIGRVLVVP